VIPGSVLLFAFDAAIFFEDINGEVRYFLGKQAAFSFLIRPFSGGPQSCATACQVGRSSKRD
jgi:hypothetical protein